MRKPLPSKTIYFMSPGIGVLTLGLVKNVYIVLKHKMFKTLLLYTSTEIEQKDSLLRKTTKSSAKIVYFDMSPKIRVLILGRGQIGHIIFMHVCTVVIPNSIGP